MSPLVKVYPTVVHMLAAAAEQSPEAEALVLDDRRLSYAQYVRCVAGFAQHLISLGAAGQRIATLLPNGLDSCIATYAILAAGAQCVPLNPLYTARELREILLDAQPRAWFFDAAQTSILTPLAQELGIHHISALKPGDLTVWQDQERALPRPLPEPAALAMLQYTGGTTGRAKGVNLSHRATAINVSQREGLLPTGSDCERILCVMPLFHAYALAMGLHLAVYCRGSLIIRPRYHPEDVLKTIEQECITLFPGSPTLFTSLLAHPNFHQTDFSSVHTCYSGSAPLPEETLRRWEAALGAPVLEGYGQTEAGPVLSFNPVNGRRKAGSVGVAVAQTELQIIDTETGTRVLKVGECGEIRARGPQLMEDYRNRPDATAQALRDGWLYTGDIGELDADAYLYIRDRKKDMAIVGGYNVYPREIDEVLFQHPAVLDAAAVGTADSYRGEVIRAYVVLKPDSTVSIEALHAYCTENLAKYKCPLSIEVLTSLPKTSVNKTDKTVLRRRAQQDYPA